jgi:hypothetical protein
VKYLRCRVRKLFCEVLGSDGGEYEDSFWDIAQCSLVHVDRARRQCTPLKQKSAYTRVHGAVSQEAVFFIKFFEEYSFENLNTVLLWHIELTWL